MASRNGWYQQNALSLHDVHLVVNYGVQLDLNQTVNQMVLIKVHFEVHHTAHLKIDYNTTVIAVPL